MAEDTIPENVFERAMKALMDADPTQALFERTDRDSIRYNDVADQVRAVIAAIREPSDAMKQGATIDVREGGGNYRSMWISMIDALLEQGA